MVKQASQGLRIDPAPRRRRAIPIERDTGTRQHQVVKQSVARTRVAGDRISALSEVGDVGDAPDVDDNDGALQRAKSGQRPMVDRHERCTLAARRDINSPKIRDHRDADTLRQCRAIADLYRQAIMRPMQHRLAMEAD